MMHNKELYDQIPVPDSLSKLREEARIRARKQGQVRRIKTWGSTAAACVALVAVSNTPVAYAALADVPVVGSIVRVLHFGEGGQITDGAQVGSILEEGKLQIWFADDAESLANTPFYTIEKKEAPNRLVLTLNGVRQFSPEEFISVVQQMNGVKDAYRQVILDDSAVRVVIALEDQMDYTLTEYQTPGYLELAIFADATPEANAPTYFIRSEAMPMGEPLAQLAEAYQKYGSSIVKTQDGQYILSIGQFSDEAEAALMLDKINGDAVINGTSLTIDHCNSNQNPK